MKDAAFSDGTFSNIAVLRNRVSHSDRQSIDLLCNCHRSCLRRYRQFRFQPFARYQHDRRVRPAERVKYYRVM